MAVLAGCGKVKELGGTFADMARIQAELQKKLGQGDVQIMIMNGSMLQLKVINSNLSALRPPEAQAKCLEIAKFAHDSYAGRSNLQAVSVAIATKKSYLFLLHFEQVHMAMSFPAKVLSRPQPAAAGRV